MPTLKNRFTPYENAIGFLVLMAALYNDMIGLSSILAFLLGNSLFLLLIIVLKTLDLQSKIPPDYPNPPTDKQLIVRCAWVVGLVTFLGVGIVLMVMNVLLILPNTVPTYQSIENLRLATVIFSPLIGMLLVFPMLPIIPVLVDRYIYPQPAIHHALYETKNNLIPLRAKVELATGIFLMGVLVLLQYQAGLY